MQMQRILIVSLAMLGCAWRTPAQATSPTLNKVKEFDLPGPPGKRFDYLTIDTDDDYLISAHLAANQTYVIDLRADKVDKSTEYAFDSDGGPFIRQGIPALDMNVDDVPYEEIHHKSTDTLDRVDRRNLAIGAAMTAVTAYAVADAPKRIGVRGARRKE